MEAQRKLQEETMSSYAEVVDLLDEVVVINSERTGLHHKFTELQALQRRNQEEYGGYYRYVASFIAQRACHTAQANALLLRHGFQDQAFELWRTIVNLRDNLEGMIGEEQETSAERFLNATAAEMRFLDEKAKKRGSILGRMFDDSDNQSIEDLADRMKIVYGNRILEKDGWKNRNHLESEYKFEKLFQAEIDHNYQLASKLQHGSPISTLIGADFEMRPLRNPLEHRIEGVPVQCMLTGYMLHSVVNMFCKTTEEIEDSIDDTLMKRSESALLAISQFHKP